MQKLLVLLTLTILMSCGENTSDKLVVKGNIKGLKKGVVYLKKAQDSIFVTLDSMIVKGNSNFKLESAIENPEVLFLFLDKNDTEESRITFFADKGITEINTTLNRFNYDAKIKGSKQQELLEEYLNIASKFNNQGLELVKESFDALKANDKDLIEKTKAEYNNLEKRKYLYTANFAINNRNSEVAPYVALTDLYNANIKLLNIVNDTLTPSIKNSIYGKGLQNFIKSIKTDK